MSTSSLPPLPLPAGVKSSYIDTTTSCGLLFHILSSEGSNSTKKPLILLLHGAPELAFTWRHIIAPLAAQGYYVVAPDQRGYGRTTGWDTRPYDSVDLTEFHITNLVRDLICLVYSLGYTEVHCIISHDFGTVPGSYAPLMRPDIFKSSIQVSIPFVAPGLPPLGVIASENPPETLATALHRFAILEDQLEKLHPPRKHYQWYNSGPTAANDWVSGGTLGLRAFFRGYLYLKSHDGPGNKVKPPKEFTANALSVMPGYLLLPVNKTMPEVVESMLQGFDPQVSEAWLSQKDLDVYVSEYQRSGFQGNLNWYRVITSKLEMARDTLILAGAKLRVPTAFITGEQDWSSYLIPGSIERYSESCTDFRGVTVIPNAGHWVPGEQPEALLEAFIQFLDSLKPTGST